MSEFQVETSVPVPQHGRTKYPWDSMNSGDSILVEGENRRRLSVRNAALAWLKRNRPGWTVVTRRVGENAYRIWLLDGEAS